jgi:hypothetical protein
MVVHLCPLMTTLVPEKVILLLEMGQKESPILQLSVDSSSNLKRT